MTYRHRMPTLPCLAGETGDRRAAEGVREARRGATGARPGARPVHLRSNLTPAPSVTRSRRHADVEVESEKSEREHPGRDGRQVHAERYGGDPPQLRAQLSPTRSQQRHRGASRRRPSWHDSSASGESKDEERPRTVVHFMELFAGKAGLSEAVACEGLRVYSCPRHEARQGRGGPPGDDLAGTIRQHPGVRGRDQAYGSRAT